MNPRALISRARDGLDQADGQVLVLFTLMLVTLLLAIGLVVDVGGSWGQFRTQQKVADVAALAGATAEANGADRATIIQAAVDSAVANGYQASEVTVNIPPTSGKYAPGGSQSGPLSTNDCSTPALYPCWIEVLVDRPHQNSFASVVGMNQFGVTARGVSVGGIANGVSNGLSPIMFNYRAVTDHGPNANVYCDPNPAKCDPNSAWPINSEQFAWTTFCVKGGNCNVDAATAKGIINGGEFQVEVYLGMDLGPHNHGDMTSVCHALLDMYPSGADIPVAINDDNGNLVGFWIWHLDTANSDCEGHDGEQLAGYFVSDETSTLPLTISAGGSSATFGIPLADLVE